MIRVNLLPQKKRAERAASIEPSSSQRWILVVFGLVLLEAIGFVLFHQTKEKELAEQKAKNQAAQADITSIRTLVEQHTQVKADLELLRAREDAISKLEKARTGPTAAMLELSRLLTPGKGPTVDPDRYQAQIQKNPLSAINPAWDARRVWIKSFRENGRLVEIEGLARDSTDVSELALRLKASSYFYDVRLLPGGKKADEAAMVGFGMQLKVRY
ncbi:MAG: PilN domain-containing protein [Polyangiaceae bacterium]|nr:PilN domain-containing protein [Polyangiaceae bacterium]